MNKFLRKTRFRIETLKSTVATISKGGFSLINRSKGRFLAHCTGHTFGSATTDSTTSLLLYPVSLQPPQGHLPSASYPSLAQTGGVHISLPGWSSDQVLLPRMRTRDNSLHNLSSGAAWFRYQPFRQLNDCSTTHVTFGSHHIPRYTKFFYQQTGDQDTLHQVSTQLHL